MATPASVSNRPGPMTRAGQQIAAPDEAGDEAVGGAFVEVALRADLAHRAIGHHDQAVGHDQRFFLVVRHHHRRDAELVLQLADLDAHGLAQLGVEVRQRLVEQQHVGPDDQRARQRDALLLAAGELARQALGEAAQAHQSQRFGDARRNVGFRHLAHLEPEGHVLGDGQMREQRVALEHHAGVALPRRQHRDVLAAEAHAAGGRRDEAGDHAQRRGLAAAARPEQHHELAVAHVERDVVHGDGRAEMLGQAFDLERPARAIGPTPPSTA